MSAAWAWSDVPGLAPEVRAHVGLKLCPRCHATKPIAAFPLTTQANGNPRVHPWCIECRREHDRAYRRARKLALTVTARERADDLPVEDKAVAVEEGV